MRYAQGTVAVSLSRDIPLLVQVRNAKFITHKQLFELMQSGGYECSRQSFNWRMKRLLRFNYISICEGNFGTGALVYRITKDGLVQLENHGQFAVILNSATQHLPHPSQAYHALELTSIRLALGRANLLASWQSDVETASSNIVLPGPLAKDYDAIVDVWNGDQMARFALEYERTLKSARQYGKVREALEIESNVGCVLYLTAGFEIALHLAHELSGIPRRLAFATAQAFRHRLLDTPVILQPEQPQIIFKQLLRGVF
jgi:hypothetical protein